LHAQRTQALHAVKVIRKKKILQRNAQKRKQFTLKYNFNNVQSGNSILTFVKFCMHKEHKRCTQ